MSRAPRPRGLTLIELMIATLIMVTAIASAMVAFISLSRSLWSADQSRAANSAARDAMVPIESALRDLGWGLDSRSEYQARDIRNLLTTGCDRAYVLKWAAELGVLDYLADIER